MMLEKLRKYLTPAASMNADEARKFINEHDEGSYTLLDVRQPKEYEESHIPGAKLIPLAQLSSSMNELDKDKPTLVYCAIGGRSRAAAQMLAGEGFDEVYNIKGGIQAWDGVTAEGPVDLKLDIIADVETPAEIVKLAYGMEKALGDFYRTMADRADNTEVAGLLNKLASVEDRHREFLVQLYNTMGSDQPKPEKWDEEVETDILEGGYDVESFIRDNERYLKSVPGILDIAMSLETQALDLYLRFAAYVDRDDSREILQKIADEEKAHLNSLGDMRDKHG